MIFFAHLTEPVNILHHVISVFYLTHSLTIDLACLSYFQVQRIVYTCDCPRSMLMPVSVCGIYLPVVTAGPDSWLVRPSDTTEGDFSIFFYCNTAVQRFKIHKSGHQYSMGGRLFDGSVSMCLSNIFIWITRNENTVRCMKGLAIVFGLSQFP